MNYTEEGKQIIRIGGNQPQTSKAPLQVVTRDFKSFLKPATSQAKFVELPESLPEVKSSPPKVVERDFYGYGKIPVHQAIYLEGSWTHEVRTADTQTLKEKTPFLIGSNFVELDDGVYTIGKGKAAGQRVTNATVRLVGITRRIKVDDSLEEILTCSVRWTTLSGTQKEELEVLSEEFKSLFSLIRKKFRDVFVLQSRSEVLEEYLSAVNQLAFGEHESNLRRKTTAAVMGWSQIEGESRYRLGDEAFYRGYVLPTVNLENCLEIFKRGFEFRTIGHGDEIAEILWLFAHAPYVLKAFREANAPVTSVLFLKGRTNLLKTATASVLANVFKLNRNDVAIRLSSTQASLQHQIVALRDNLILVDDFSNTTGSDNLKMTRNAEFLIRAIGDGRFSSKMNVADLSKLANDSIRVSVILTGEEGLDLDTSSMYRIVTLPVYENTFDGAVLAKFQREPEILRDYFALFIRFLEELPANFIPELNQRFAQYRRHYANVLKVPRFVDFASTMSLLAEVVSNFGKWCGCNENFATEFFGSATTAVLRVLEEHQQVSAESDIVRRFIFALNQTLDTSVGTHIANDEDSYVRDESSYIGFQEEATQTLWLRFDEIFALVKKFYCKLGQSWTVKEQTVKEELLRRGISEGTLMPKGSVGNEYLKRAKKGSRRRMLVLRIMVLKDFE